MNKKIIVATLGLSSMFMFVCAQETVMPISEEITPVVQTGDVDPNGTVGTCITLGSDLRYKMKDTTSSDDITTLQDFLMSNHYMSGQPTGYFGLATVQGVKQFQHQQGLSRSGFVGPLTRAKINSVSCSSGFSTSDNPAPVAPTPGGTKQKIENDITNRKREQGSHMPDGKGFVETGTSVTPVPSQDTSLLKAVSVIMSEADKQALQEKENNVKKLRSDMEQYYRSSRPTDSNQMSDSVKAELKAKSDLLNVAQKDLDDTRKAIFERVKASLSDGQRIELEKIMHARPAKESRRVYPQMTTDIMQASNTPSMNVRHQFAPCDSAGCDDFGFKGGKADNVRPSPVLNPRVESSQSGSGNN